MTAVRFEFDVKRSAALTNIERVKRSFDGMDRSCQAKLTPNGEEIGPVEDSHDRLQMFWES
jgi:hypothetical protein